LQKTTSTPTTYALALRDFANFVKSWGPFSKTPTMKDLDLFHINGGIWLELVDAHLHPLHVTFWHKCVLHHRVSGIGVSIHLSIAKCEIG
jgi:hypothetical protein